MIRFLFMNLEYMYNKSSNCLDKVKALNIMCFLTDLPKLVFTFLKYNYIKKRKQK